MPHCTVLRGHSHTGSFSLSAFTIVSFPWNGNCRCFNTWLEDCLLSCGFPYPGASASSAERLALLTVQAPCWWRKETPCATCRKGLLLTAVMLQHVMHTDLSQAWCLLQKTTDSRKSNFSEWLQGRATAGFSEWWATSVKINSNWPQGNLHNLWDYFVTVAQGYLGSPWSPGERKAARHLIMVNESIFGNFLSALKSYDIFSPSVFGVWDALFSFFMIFYFKGTDKVILSKITYLSNILPKKFSPLQANIC